MDDLRTDPATGELVNAIAGIETSRRHAENEAGLAASCASALGRLHELLDRAIKELQQRGLVVGHPEHVDTVVAEIVRVRALADSADQAEVIPKTYRGPSPWQCAHRGPAAARRRVPKAARTSTKLH